MNTIKIGRTGPKLTIDGTTLTITGLRAPGLEIEADGFEVVFDNCCFGDEVDIRAGRPPY